MLHCKDAPLQAKVMHWKFFMYRILCHNNIAQHNPNLKLARALKSFTWSFSLMFCCRSCNFSMLVHSHRSVGVDFGHSRQSFFRETVTVPNSKHN